MFQTKDPDDSVVAIFKDFAVKNEGQDAQAGRPIFDDHGIVELRYPGSKDFSSLSGNVVLALGRSTRTGEQVKVSYAERFRRQYQQFKAQATQTKTGTPLTYALFLTEGSRAELRALNIYTVEALASIDGQQLKNLGLGGREMKNAAMEYLEEDAEGGRQHPDDGRARGVARQEPDYGGGSPALKERTARPRMPSRRGRV